MQQAANRNLSLPQSVSTWIQKNAKTLGVMTGGVALIVVAVLGWMSSQAGQEEKASAALYEANQTLDLELAAIAPSLAPPAPATDPKTGKPVAAKPATQQSIEFKSFDVAAKLPKGIAALTEVYQKYPRTASGYEAAMKVGDLYFKHGGSSAAAQAIEQYQKGADAAQKPLQKAMAYLAIGSTQENLGKNDEALKAYERAAGTGEKAVEGESLLAVARAQTLLGKNAEARKIYDQVIQKLSGTEYARQAEARKVLLKND